LHIFIQILILKVILYAVVSLLVLICSSTTTSISLQIIIAGGRGRGGSGGIPLSGIRRLRLIV